MQEELLIRKTCLSLVIDRTSDVEVAAAAGFAVKTWHKICTSQAAHDDEE